MNIVSAFISLYRSYLDRKRRRRSRSRSRDRGDKGDKEYDRERDKKELELDLKKYAGMTGAQIERLKQKEREEHRLVSTQAHYPLLTISLWLCVQWR